MLLEPELLPHTGKGGLIPGKTKAADVGEYNTEKASAMKLVHSECTS